MSDPNRRAATERTRIKFCGMQTVEDIAASTALGVDALGFIFAASVRRITIERARELALHVPPLVSRIAVVANPSSAECEQIKAAMPGVIFQFCGFETPEFCSAASAGTPYFKVHHIGQFAGAVATAVSAATSYSGLPIFDTARAGQLGGTGETFDWSQVLHFESAFILAGGLHAENVGQAVRALRPFAVDVRSGIEAGGQKDRARMHAFVAAVRAADNELRIHATQ